MNNEAVDNGSPRLRSGAVPSGPGLEPGPARIAALLRRRPVRMGIEAGYDALAWLAGLAAAAWATRDLPGTPGHPGLAALRTAAGSASLHTAAAPGGLRTAAALAGLLTAAAVAMAVMSVTAGLLAGLYRGRFRRGSLDEVIGVVIAGCGLALALAIVGPLLVPGQRAALATITGAAAFAVPAMLGARYVLFATRQRCRRTAPAAVKVIVFGAGDAGAMLIGRLAREADPAYQPVAILDDDPAKRRLRIRGVPVLGDRSRMADVAAATGATVLVIAIARASGPVIRELTAQAEQCGLTPKVVPTVTELLNGSARIEGVRDPRISDLLGRRPVRTDVAGVAGHFAGKRIMVTGAGGSIGAELCRHLHRFGPAELIMLDRDESALHATQFALHGRALLDSDDTVLADIRDRDRIHEVFARFRPQIVFHAAALKHLPLLERYPAEAVKTNVWGTWTVLEAAAACGAGSFVNISTDKAADPVSVLGYSKRVAERLTAHMSGRTAGSYLSVRLGNVLGSRGSVLGAMSAQVAAGGPVTVTHPEVTRYFMTADEAIQLVLQAAVIGGSGEVLVLDMGEPVRIADLARRLAASSPHPVPIEFTGLRPGEKLAEDLLSRDEVDNRPRHPLIRHAPVSPLPPAELTGLDPRAEAATLRAGLARCAMRTAGQPATRCSP